MTKNVLIEKKPASLTKRIIAYLIDFLIISLIVALPFNKILNSIKQDNFNFYYNFNYLINNPSQVTQLILISIFIIILSISYWTILEFKLRQTIGKIITNIKVASKKKNFTISQCIVRNLSKPITIIFLFDIIYLLLNKKQNQRYLEKISDTVVIQEVLRY